jgi:homoserine kinase
VWRLREAGVPAVISGAGPTVLTFTAARESDSTGPEVGTGWHRYPLNVDLRGAFAELDGL